MENSKNEELKMCSTLKNLKAAEVDDQTTSIFWEATEEPTRKLFRLQFTKILLKDTQDDFILF